MKLLSVAFRGRTFSTSAFSCSFFLIEGNLVIIIHSVDKTKVRGRKSSKQLMYIVKPFGHQSGRLDLLSMVV